MNRLIIQTTPLIRALCLFFTMLSAQANQCNEGSRPNLPDDRFLIINDIYAKDRVTGLLWTRCTIGQFFEDGQCQSSSQRQVNSWYNWTDAKRQLARINAASEDIKWRIPTIDELTTLIERTCQDPATNETIFPDFPAWTFWTNTPFSLNNDYRWIIDFYQGKASTVLEKSATHNLRLVSGTPPKLTIQDPVIDRQIEIEKWQDGLRDLTNPSLSQLQLFDNATLKFPKDIHGKVNWVKTLSDGFIKPRTSIEGFAPMQQIEQNILYKNTEHMPWVKFSHSIHTQWLSCNNCHTSIFAEKAYNQTINMQNIYQGQQCGVCHGKVAFSTNSCERCHSVMHKNVPENWRTFIAKPDSKK